MDTMHFDLGGRRVGMGGGSWEKGLTEEQRRLFPGVNSQGIDALNRAAVTPEMQRAADQVVAAAAAAKAAKQGRNAEAPPKPEAAFDAARRAGAAASVAQANAANAAVVSRTSNDNRSAQDNRRYDETHLHNVNVYPANGTQSSIMAELKQASKGGKAFAAAADYGKA